ncbi:MAG: YfhO family protein [Candidatus Omnitrophota bacterium]
MKKTFIRNIDVIIISAVLLALLIIIFKDAIFSDYMFMRRDIGRYYYPIRSFVADTFRAGEIPLWNPFLFCGTPLHASIQNSVFYPFSIIYYVMEDTAKGFGYFIILHLFLCGLFTYLFMKSIGASKEGSFLAAFCFTFSGYVISAINLTISLNSVTWFPLVMLLFFKAIKERSYRYSSFLAIALTLMFLAGDPSIVISTLAIIFLVSGYLFTERLIKRKSADGFIVYNLLTTFSLFFLLGAFQSIPALEYYIRTARTSMNWQEASVWSVPFSDLISLVVPYFNDLSCYYQNYWDRQAWLDNYYVGITTIFLACFCLPMIKKVKIIKFFYITCFITIAVCLGKNFILYPFLYKVIPFVRIMRYPVRFFYIFTFSVCVLAGLGLDRLKAAISSPRMKRIAGIFLVIGFIASILAIMLTYFSDTIAKPIIDKVVELKTGEAFNLEEFPSLVYCDIINLRRTLLYVGAFGLFLFLWTRVRSKRFMPYLILLLVGFDLLLTNIGYEPLVKASYFKEPTENIRYVLKDKSLFRIFPSPYSYDRFTWVHEGGRHESIKSTKDYFVNNRMMEFGLYDMWGYDSTTLSRNRQIGHFIYNLKDPGDTNILGLLNVKYISSKKGMELPGFEKVNESPYAAVFKNAKCLPRAQLIRNVRLFNKDEDILKYVCSKDFDADNEIVFERISGIKESSGIESALKQDRVDILEYGPHTVGISIFAKKPAFLLLSDTYYPGWKVFVDGEEKKIYRADYFLRAVRVSEGEHKVRFIYDPFSFKAGSVITIVTLIILIIYISAGCLRLTRR